MCKKVDVTVEVSQSDTDPETIAVVVHPIIATQIVRHEDGTASFIFKLPRDAAMQFARDYSRACFGVAADALALGLKNGARPMPLTLCDRDPPPPFEA